MQVVLRLMIGCGLEMVEFDGYVNIMVEKLELDGKDYAGRICLWFLPMELLVWWF